MGHDRGHPRPVLTDTDRRLAGEHGRAAKADVLSLSAFEVGLFTWMALTYWVSFPSPHLEPNRAAYWFMMQIGMAIGLATSYPMNVYLVRKRIKEAM